MAHQSLYRRYRPRRFGEVRGQEHVVRALLNAVRDGSEGHAYLFSGPRGTGKTSTARIFAKALNCEKPSDGEPCCECESCVSIEEGRSYDLFELDAASNNGVDAMRDLTSRAMVGSPGRTKVYILDEVHMLSAAASNALLKTLEEPPDHVRFVLATTDPQKVLPTIRSRTQHFEFRLLSADELTELVRWVSDDAGLDVDDEALAHVVRQGAGSARDTLSALDQVVAAGGVLAKTMAIDRLVDALAEEDTGAAIVAVADALDEGREPRTVAEALVANLREAFLSSVRAERSQLGDLDRQKAQALAERMGGERLIRAIELLGAALAEMRQAPQPRIPLEVALVRITRPAADTTLGAIADRVARLERGMVAAPAGEAPGAPAADADEAAVVPAAPAEAVRRPRPPAAVPAEASPRQRAAAAPEEEAPAPRPRGQRPSLGAVRARGVAPRSAAPDAASPASAVEEAAAAEALAAETLTSEALTSEALASEAAAPSDAPAARPQPAPAAKPAPAAATSGAAVSRDDLVVAFPQVIGQLKGMSRALFAQGRFVSLEGGVAVFALDNAPTVERARRYVPDVEALIASTTGAKVRLDLVTEDEAGKGSPVAAPPAEDDVADSDEIDLEEVAALPVADVATGIQRLTAAFPGAEVIEEGP